jgi:hypothetical protein
MNFRTCLIICFILHLHFNRGLVIVGHCGTTAVIKIGHLVVEKLYQALENLISPTEGEDYCLISPRVEMDQLFCGFIQFGPQIEFKH